MYKCAYIGFLLNLELSLHDQGVMEDHPVTMVRQDRRVSEPFSHEPPVATKGEATSDQLTESEIKKIQRESFLVEGKVTHCHQMIDMW